MNRNEQLIHQLLFDQTGLLQQTLVKAMLINYIICNVTLTLDLAE